MEYVRRVTTNDYDLRCALKAALPVMQGNMDARSGKVFNASVPVENIMAFCKNRRNHKEVEDERYHL